MTENQSSIVNENQDINQPEIDVQAVDDVNAQDQVMDAEDDNQQQEIPARPKNFPNIVDLLALLGVFFASSMLAVLITSLIGITAQSNLGKQTFIIYVLSFGVTLLFALPYSYFRSNRTFNPLKFSLKGINMATVLWGFVLILALGVVLEPLTSTFDKQYIDQLSTIMGSGDWFMLSALVMAPLFEEVLFRGVIQGALTNRYNAIIGILVSSLVFGLVHGNPVQMCNAFFVGLVLGYIYHRTGTLWAVIILHFFNNIFSYFIWMLGGQTIITVRDIITNTHVYNVIYAFAGAVTLISFILLFRALSRKQQPQLDNKSL